MVEDTEVRMEQIGNEAVLSEVETGARIRANPDDLIDLADYQ